MDKIAELVLTARQARKAYQDQYALMWKDNKYNGRYAKKARVLYAAWKKSEDTLLQTIYLPTL